MDKFTFTDEGIRLAQAYLKELDLNSIAPADYNTVHLANYHYNSLNKETKTMTLDEIHGIKPKEL